MDVTGDVLGEAERTESRQTAATRRSAGARLLVEDLGRGGVMRRASGGVARSGCDSAEESGR